MQEPETKLFRTHTHTHACRHAFRQTHGKHFSDICGKESQPYLLTITRHGSIIKVTALIRTTTNVLFLNQPRDREEAKQPPTMLLSNCVKNAQELPFSII